ncbi:MAG: STAS domain-containing protein [Clostridiales bacterium]|nr:STAS domain-containing protein [Clostridiales bacterium]
MTIKTSQEGANTILAIEGRIDTNTSPQLQDALLKAFQTAKTVTVDFAAVPYISSAGLRALLIGQKTAASKGLTMELKNVSPAVFSILESVGFSKILTIN